MVVSLMDLTISETKCRRAKALRPLRFAEEPPSVVARASQRVYIEILIILSQIIACIKHICYLCVFGISLSRCTRHNIFS